MIVKSFKYKNFYYSKLVKLVKLLHNNHNNNYIANMTFMVNER
jgi:hypothetical protein